VARRTRPSPARGRSRAAAHPAGLSRRAHPDRVVVRCAGRHVARDNAWRFGTALGLGFGIGEILLLVQLLQPSQAVSAAPWTGLTGFISERYIVCLTHGAFTAAALSLWRNGRPLSLGLLAAMGLHFLANLPIALASLFMTDLATRSAVLAIWLVLVWSAAIVGLIALARADARTNTKS
jgi:hypothetical protein